MTQCSNSQQTQMKVDAAMTITREPQQLEKSLFLNRRLIGIDGDPGAGKSTLAREIQHLVGGSIIALDDFLCKPMQPYLSQYKASDLVDHFRSSNPLPRIIEGVVLLDALDFLNASADMMVFATLQNNGTWDYAKYIQDRAWQPKSSSTREIAGYYRRRAPWESAQLLTTLHYSASATRPPVS